MLVLRRDVDQKIVLSNGVEIMVVAAGRGWAKLGIEAPREVAIDREELLKRSDFKRARAES